MTPPTSPASKRRRRWLIAVLLLGAVMLAWAVGGLVVAATLFSGTSLTRDDFESDAEARAFVSAHLPVPLPSSAMPRTLTYDRFTDWRLKATVALKGAGSVARYLEAVEAAKEVNHEYCGDQGTGQYFLADTYACGTVAKSAEAGVLTVTCYTW